MKNKKALIIAFSLALVISLAFSSFSCVSFAAMPTVSTVSFTETFDENTLTAFESNNLTYAKNCVTGGKLVQPAGTETQLFIKVKDKSFDFATYTDYTVSAKLTLGEANTAPTAIITAGIAARATTANTGGYEYQICCAADQTKGYVRLYDRSQQIGTKGIIATNDNELFDIGVEQTVMMTVKGNNIECFLNGESVIKYTDKENTYPTGSAAIRLATKAYVSSCDDFTVEHTEVDESKFCDDFNSYSADTGSKKAAAMKKNGWAVSANALAGYLDGSAITIPANSTYDQVGYQTSGAKGALGWNDYSVEADVTFGTGTLTNNVYAGVSGRHNDVTGNSPNGYEIEIFIKTDGTSGMRIYARNGGSELATCDASIEQGVTYNVKAVFQGSTIYAYLDGNLKLTVTDSTFPIGFAGIRYIGKKTNGVGIETKIDNFVVYDYDEAPMAYFEDFSGYTPSYLEDGVTYDRTPLEKAGWNSSTNTILRASVPCFANGKLAVPQTFTDANGNTCDYSLFLTGNKDLKALQNYSFSCDIKPTTSTVGSSYICICGRSSDPKNGYFVKVRFTTTKIRDVDIIKNVNNVKTSLKKYEEPTESKRIDAADGVKITLSFSGNKISVVINDKTVIDQFEDNTYSSGSIGFYSAKTDRLNDFEIDNIKVIDFDNGYKKVTVGDFDDDDDVDADDVAVLKTRIVTETGDADVNYDGATNLLDIIRIKKLLVSL